MARRPARMSAAAKAEAKASGEAPLPDPIARAEEEGKINLDVDEDAGSVDHAEDKSDVGDPASIGRAYDEGRIVPRDVDPDASPVDLDTSPDFVENGVAGEAEGGSKKNRKARVGEIVGYVSTARRAGIRNRAEEPAIVTGINDDGSVSLTIFGVDMTRSVRKVGSNRSHEEHWKPLS